MGKSTTYKYRIICSFQSITYSFISANEVSTLLVDIESGYVEEAHSTSTCTLYIITGPVTKEELNFKLSAN